MPRPVANVLLEIHNPSTHKTDKVIASEGIWSVYYQNRPINLKTESIIAFVTPRYKPVSFSNSGHAISLAKKLNKKFNTSDFTVVLLSHAEVIYPK